MLISEVDEPETTRVATTQERAEAVKRRDRHTVRGRDLVTVPESAREPNRRSEKRMRGVGEWTEPLGEQWRTGGEL